MTIFNQIWPKYQYIWVKFGQKWLRIAIFVLLFHNLIPKIKITFYNLLHFIFIVSIALYAFWWEIGVTHHLGQIWSNMVKNANKCYFGTGFRHLPNNEITFYYLLSFIILYAFSLVNLSYPTFLGQFVDIWVKIGQKWLKITTLGLVSTYYPKTEIFFMIHCALHL